MKKTILLLVTILLINISYAQEEHKEYYDNGNLKEVGQYDDNGKGTGEWKEYHENGQLSSIGKYENGKRIGEWFFYYKDGRKWSLNFDTKLFSYFYKNGKLSSIGKKNNEFNEIGVWKTYYENGQLESYIDYGDRKLIYYHISKYYYENGQLKEDNFWIENTYISKKYNKKGEMVLWNALKFIDDGEISRYYYPNGQVSWYTKYNTEEGRRCAVEEKSYHKNGQLSMIGNYSPILFDENDFPYSVRTSEWKYYYENGQLRSIGKYENGKRTGEWKEYHKNGKIYKVNLFKNGGLMDILTCKDNQGNILDKGTIINGNGTVKEYDETGNLLKTTTYKKGIEQE